MILVRIILIIYCSFNAEGYIRQADKCYQGDDLRGAMEYIGKAIKLNPKSPKAYQKRAQIREALEDPDFEDDYNYAIDLENGE